MGDGARHSMTGTSRHPMTLVILTELNALPVVLMALLGRRSLCLIGTDPKTRFTIGVLKRLADWLIVRGHMRDPRIEFPEFDFQYRHPHYSCFTSFFRRTEPWIDRYFRFADLTPEDDSYVLAIKNAACNSIDKRADLVVLLCDILSRHGASVGGVMGANTEIAGLCEAHAGRRPSGTAGTHPRLRRLTNAVQTVMVGLYSLIWVARRVTLRHLPEARYRLGMHNLGHDASNQVNFRTGMEIVHDPSEICVAHFNAADIPLTMGAPAAFGHVIVSDGRLAPADAWAAARMLVRDVARLFSRHGWMPPRLFWHIVKLPFTRVLYRAFLSRYRIDNFWGRDDFDEAHIIRSDEMRRLGLTSLGILHGIPSTELVSPQWRYMDFDYYYMFGRDLYERHYADRWPTRMQVRFTGAYSMTPKMVSELDMSERRGIVFFPSPCENERAVIDALFTVARGFPERTVYFKVKSGRWNEGFFSSVNDRLKAEPCENIRVTQDDAYSLISRCGYSVGTLSTVVVESIYYGVKAFALDIGPPDQENYYRFFAGLCVHSGEEIVSRIRALEQGVASYPWGNFATLVDQEGPHVFDVVRRDIGETTDAPLPWPRPWLHGVDEAYSEDDMAPDVRSNEYGT